jgi:hypothetical protein
VVPDLVNSHRHRKCGVCKIPVEGFVLNRSPGTMRSPTPSLALKGEEQCSVTVLVPQVLGQAGRLAPHDR